MLSEVNENLLGDERASSDNYDDIEKSILPLGAADDQEANNVAEPWSDKEKFSFAIMVSLLLVVTGFLIANFVTEKETKKCLAHKGDGDDFYFQYDTDCNKHLFYKTLILGGEVTAGLFGLAVALQYNKAITATIKNIPNQATECVASLQRLCSSQNDEIVVPYRPLNNVNNA